MKTLFRSVPLYGYLSAIALALVMFTIPGSATARPAPVCHSASINECITPDLRIDNGATLTLPGFLRVEVEQQRPVTFRIDLPAGGARYDTSATPVVFGDADVILFNRDQLVINGHSTFAVGQIKVICSTCLAGDSIATQVRLFDPNGTTELLFAGNMVLARVFGQSEIAIDTFNPGGNTNQQSVLRIINTGPEDALVRVLAVDDTGAAGSVGELLIDAGTAVQLTSADVENGNQEKGMLAGIGTGSGKWLLQLASDSPGIIARNLIRNAGDGGIADLGGVVAVQRP